MKKAFHSSLLCYFFIQGKSFVRMNAMLMSIQKALTGTLSR